MVTALPHADRYYGGYGDYWKYYVDGFGWGGSYYGSGWVVRSLPTRKEMGPFTLLLAKQVKGRGGDSTAHDLKSTAEFIRLEITL